MNIGEQCILYDAPIFRGKIVGWKMSRPNWHKEKSIEYGKKKIKIKEKIASEEQEDKKKRIKYEDLVFRIFLKGFDYCNNFYFGTSYKRILSKYKNPYLTFVLSKSELVPFEYMNRICTKRTLSEFERDVKDARDFFVSNLHHTPWNLALNQIYDYIKKKDKTKELFRKDKRRKLAPIEESVVIDYKSLFWDTYRDEEQKKRLENDLYYKYRGIPIEELIKVLTREEIIKLSEQRFLLESPFNKNKIEEQDKKKKKMVPLEEDVPVKKESKVDFEVSKIDFRSLYKSLFPQRELGENKKIEEHVYSPSFTIKKVLNKVYEVATPEGKEEIPVKSKYPVLDLLESKSKGMEKELRKKRKELVINTWTNLCKKEILFRYLDLFYKDMSLEFLNATPFYSYVYNYNHRYIDAFFNTKTLYGDLRQSSYINMDIISLFLDIDEKTICALRAEKIVIYKGSIDALDEEDLIYKAYNAVNQGYSYAYFMTTFEKQCFDRDVQKGKIEFDKFYSKEKVQDFFFIRWDDVLRRFSNAISKKKKIYDYDEKIQRIIDFKEYYPSPRADFWDRNSSKNDP